MCKPWFASDKAKHKQAMDRQLTIHARDLRNAVETYNDERLQLWDELERNVEEYNEFAEEADNFLGEVAYALEGYLYDNSEDMSDDERETLQETFEAWSDFALNRSVGFVLDPTLCPPRIECDIDHYDDFHKLTEHME